MYKMHKIEKQKRFHSMSIWHPHAGARLSNGYLRCVLAVLHHRTAPSID